MCDPERKSKIKFMSKGDLRSRKQVRRSLDEGELARNTFLEFSLPLIEGKRIVG
jgi:hypothetical protein